MTGSAFPIAYRARDVVYRLAPQDTYNYRKLREQKGVPRCIGAEAGGFMLRVVFGSQDGTKQVKKPLVL